MVQPLVLNLYHLFFLMASYLMYRNKRNNVLLEIQFKRFENNDFIIFFRRRIASKCLDVKLYHPTSYDDSTLEFMTSYLMGASPPLEVK